MAAAGEMVLLGKAGGREGGRGVYNNIPSSEDIVEIEERSKELRMEKNCK